MTVGTAGFASRVMNYRPTHWWRLHGTTAVAQIVDSVVLNNAVTPVVAYRGSISAQQPGPLHSSQYTYSMVFNGSTDYIEYTQNDVLFSGTTGSFFCFYKRSAAGTAGVIVGGTGSNRRVSVEILSTGAPKLNLQLSVGNSTVTTATSGFTDDAAWHLLVITSDGATAPKMYIDGVACTVSNVLSGTAVAGSWFTYVSAGGNVPTDIGALGGTGTSDGTSLFSGSLSEIGYVSGTTWSASDVTYIYTGASFYISDTLMNFNDMLVEKYWRQQDSQPNNYPALTIYANFDDASGNIQNNGYHGDTASFWAPTNPSYGQAGSGYDVINKGIAFTAAGSNGITIGSAGIGRYGIATGETYGAVFLIVKLDVGGPACWLWSVKGDAVANFANYFGVIVDTNLLKIQGVATAGNSRIHQSAAITDLRDGTYHFLAFVQRGDGTGIHMFVDGVELSYIADVTAGTPPTVNFWGGDYISYTGGTTTISKAHTGAAPAAATWDHVSFIANRIISDADIANFQAARSRSTSSSAAIPTRIRRTGRKTFPF